MNLTLSYGEDSIELTNKQCISLELSLNTSEFGKRWIDLGDILYSWGSNTNYKDLQKEKVYYITLEQLRWLKNTLTKN